MADQTTGTTSAPPSNAELWGQDKVPPEPFLRRTSLSLGFAGVRASDTVSGWLNDSWQRGKTSVLTGTNRDPNRTGGLTRNPNNNGITTVPDLADINITSKLGRLKDSTTYFYVVPANGDPESVITEREVEAAIEYRNSFKSGSPVGQYVKFFSTIESKYFNGLSTDYLLTDTLAYGDAGFSNDSILYWIKKYFALPELSKFLNATTSFYRQMWSTAKYNQIHLKFVLQKYQADLRSFFTSFSDSVGLLANSKYHQLDSTQPIFDVAQELYGVPIPFSANMENKVGPTARNLMYDLSKHTTASMRRNLMGVAYYNARYFKNFKVSSRTAHACNLINDIAFFVEFAKQTPARMDRIKSLFAAFNFKLFNFIQYISNIGNRCALNLRDVYAPIDGYDRDFTITPGSTDLAVDNLKAEEIDKQIGEINNFAIADARIAENLYRDTANLRYLGDTRIIFDGRGGWDKVYGPNLPGSQIFSDDNFDDPFYPGSSANPETPPGLDPVEPDLPLSDEELDAQSGRPPHEMTEAERGRLDLRAELEEQRIIREQAEQQEQRVIQDEIRRQGLLSVAFTRGSFNSDNVPVTGPGYTVVGQTDRYGREVVLSQPAAAAFAQMITASNGTVSTNDVTSSQRSPTWNARVGGATRSQHLGGNAVDIHGNSNQWIRENGPQYGWYINDYNGSHGGHFEFRGGGVSNENVLITNRESTPTNIPRVDSTTQTTGRLTDRFQERDDFTPISIPSRADRLVQTTIPPVESDRALQYANAASGRPFSNKQRITPFSFKIKVEQIDGKDSYIDVDFLLKKIVQDNFNPYKRIATLQAIKDVRIERGLRNESGRVLDDYERVVSLLSGLDGRNLVSAGNVEQILSLAGIDVNSASYGPLFRMFQSAANQGALTSSTLSQGFNAFISSAASRLPQNVLGAISSNTLLYDSIASQISSLGVGSLLPPSSQVLGLINPFNYIDINIQGIIPNVSIGSFDDIMGLASNLATSGPPRNIGDVVSLVEQVKNIICDFELPFISWPVVEELFRLKFKPSDVSKYVQSQLREIGERLADIFNPEKILKAIETAVVSYFEALYKKLFVCDTSGRLDRSGQADAGEGPGDNMTVVSKQQATAEQRAAALANVPEQYR